MSLLVALIIGLGIGVAGGFLMPENIEHLLMDVLMGISGSILGLLLYVMFLRPPTVSSQSSQPLIDIRSALASAIGAMILVLAFNGVQKLTSKNAAGVEGAEEGDIDLEKIDEP